MSINLFPWRSLKTRVSLLTVVIYVVSVWLLVFFASMILRKDMQKLLGEQQYSSVSFAANAVNQALENRIKALESVALSITPEMLAETTQLQGFMAQRIFVQSLFNGGVMVLRADGSAIAEVPLPASRIGINYAEVDTVIGALRNGRSGIGKPVMGKSQHAPVFSMAVPVRNKEGKVIAALFGVTNLAKANFLDNITQNRYGKTGGYLLVAPQYGLLVTATEKSRIMQPVPASGVNAMYDQYMQGIEGFGLATNSLGAEELTAAKRVPFAGWFLVITLPAAEAFAPIHAMQQQMLIVTLFLTLLAAALTWGVISFMLNRQLSPMLTAARTMIRQSGSTQPVQPLPVYRRDEIGELVGGFNRLLGTLAQRESLLQQILDASSVAIFVVDMEGRITRANQRMAEMFRCPLQSLKGTHYLSLVDTSETDFAQEQMQTLLASDCDSVDLDRLYRRADQSQFWGRLTGKRSYGANGEQFVLVGVISDITERRQSVLYEQFRSNTLELLAQGASLASIFAAIVRGVEQLNPSMICSILLLDTQKKHLLRGIAPGLPEFYNLAMEGMPIGMGEGSCGTAAFTGERVIVADITTHPYWGAYKELAGRAGLGACWSQPILSSSGQVVGTFAIYHRSAHAPAQFDLSVIEQSAHLASLALAHTQADEQLQLAANVFTHAREGIIITSIDGAIIDVNEAFSRITGYSRDEVLGKNPRLLNSGRHERDFYSRMWHNLIADGHWYGEVWNRRKNGEVYAEMQTISCVRDAQGKTVQYVSLFSDITTLKEHQSRLERIAHYDALTSLPNRVLLADRLRQGMMQTQRRHQRLAVAFLDLDGFKAINDKHGHEAGDHLLIAVANNMREVLRDGDTLARIGGDEFVAVMVDLVDAIDSTPFLERLLAAAALPVPFGELSLQVSASLGVTFYPQAGVVDADQLLRQADQAMYQAKLSGKNRYHIFDTEQDRNVRGHHESLERIRLALSEREFILYYQPKVNMRTGAVIGAEALIRWQHPQQGLLPPALFLPVIEDDAFAIDIGEWVIDTALQQISLWLAQGLTIPVSVNIGARQLQQENFVRRLREMLAAHPQVSPSLLELEVLETSALQDMTGVSQTMNACRAMGVTFALDDFGTGYSSLTYLKRLPVGQLKIDQSFVRDMLDDPDDLAILEGVIGLATAFRREVIAEGVETIEHGVMLLQLGCDLAQGYGIARPMPAQQLPEWANAWRPDPAWLDQEPVSREDLPLLFAGVEHRAWINELENYFSGAQETMTAPEHRRCHFGRWLEGEGRVRHGTQASFIIVDTLHRQMHRLASELCELHELGEKHQTQTRIGELHVLCNTLAAELRTMIRTILA